MLHAFPRTFELPERRADRAHSTVLPPLTAPDYLRLRRKAAGLSVAAVAKRLHEAHRAARPAMRLEWAASVVTLLETRGITARYAEALDALSAVLAFYLDVYRQLAADAVDQHPACAAAVAVAPGTMPTSKAGRRRTAAPAASRPMTPASRRTSDPRRRCRPDALPRPQGHALMTAAACPRRIHRTLKHDARDGSRLKRLVATLGRPPRKVIST